MRETYRPFGIAVRWEKDGRGGETEWYHQSAKVIEKRNEVKSL